MVAHGTTMTPTKKTFKDTTRDYIISWTSSSPVDRWWRQKYHIAFNSPEHRAVSFEDQLFEYLEDEMYYEVEQKLAEKVVDGKKIIKKKGYIPGKSIIASSGTYNEVAEEIGGTHEDVMATLDRLYSK